MFKMGIESRVASKGIAIVNFSIDQIVEFLGKEDTLKKINPQLVEMLLLLEVKDVFKVIYMQYKGIWPVSHRDFVCVSAKHVESANKVYIGTKKCEYPHP
jgi:hypothetical protein